MTDQVNENSVSSSSDSSPGGGTAEEWRHVAWQEKAHHEYYRDKVSEFMGANQQLTAQVASLSRPLAEAQEKSRKEIEAAQRAFDPFNYDTELHRAHRRVELAEQSEQAIFKRLETTLNSLRELQEVAEKQKDALLVCQETFKRLAFTTLDDFPAAKVVEAALKPSLSATQSTVDCELLSAAVLSLRGLLKHAGIADQHAEDIDAEDHHAESVARLLADKIENFLWIAERVHLEDGLSVEAGIPPSVTQSEKSKDLGEKGA